MNLDLQRLWPRAEPVLDAVIDLPEPRRSERAAELCAGDPDLAAIVAQLLRADSSADRFLESIPSELFDDADGTDPDSAVGGSDNIQRLGPFRITREIARGGMGTVLLGERDDGQFEQRVAIKLLRGGLQTEAARERLFSERRLLARLEHPHIARMYDGGVTESDVPYFIMEYVDGRSIDVHCNELKLGIEERLHLFRDVCVAIEYAHSRLIVHCDLKPHNILITTRGEVKLVDFGIASLLHGEMESQPAPLSAQRLLTPAYSAPEQRSGEAVTAATDVYQLGLVLYELLTGQRASGVSDPRPSLLDHKLAGDLDAIVVKALQPDPSQRYATAEALRRDLDAYLALRPVSAYASSHRYRLRKYVQRHRWGVTAALAVGLTVVAGLSAVIVQSQVARRERDRARFAQAHATAVNEFVVRELLQAPMPEMSLGRDLTVAEVLQNAARNVGHALHDQPQTEADVRLVLAQSYAALGRSTEAKGQAQASLDLLATIPEASTNSRDTAERTLAELMIDAGQYQLAHDRLVALRDRQRTALGESAPETLTTDVAVARALIALDQFTRAESLLRDDLSRAKALGPEAWRLVFDIQQELIRSLQSQSRSVDAERLCREVLDSLAKHVGPDHPKRIAVLRSLAIVLSGQRRFADAAAAADEAVALSRQVFGSSHPATGRMLVTNARFLDRASRDKEARAAAEEAYSILRASLGAENPDTLTALWWIAVLNFRAGDEAEAEPLFKQVAELRLRILGALHPDTMTAFDLWGIALLSQGRVAEARATQRRVLAAYEQAMADPQVDVQVILAFVKFLLSVQPEDLQNPERACDLAERAVSTTQRQNIFALLALAEAEARTGAKSRVPPLVREASTLPTARDNSGFEFKAVDLLTFATSPAEVERFLRQRLLDEQVEPPSPNLVRASTLRKLGLLLQERGNHSEAEKCLSQALELYRREFPADSWEIGDLMSEVAECIAAQGDIARAEPLLIEALRIIESHGKYAPPDIVKAAQDRLTRLHQPK